ncbi:MAG: Fic/DOC family N-terminal domain-containing protein [Lautropia sp.]|nr:Fic/DOC family N-terminal domain-containing protein [Lautropia sp.]
MLSVLPPLEHLDPARFDTPAILKRLVAAHRALAKFKGVAASMPNQNILLSTLVMTH